MTCRPTPPNSHPTGPGRPHQAAPSQGAQPDQGATTLPPTVLLRVLRTGDDGAGELRLTVSAFGGKPGSVLLRFHARASHDRHGTPLGAGVTVRASEVDGLILALLEARRRLREAGAMGQRPPGGGCESDEATP